MSFKATVPQRLRVVISKVIFRPVARTKTQEVGTAGTKGVFQLSFQKALAPDTKLPKHRGPDVSGRRGHLPREELESASPTWWCPRLRGSGPRLSLEGNQGALNAVLGRDRLLSWPGVRLSLSQALEVLSASALVQAAQRDQGFSAPELLALARSQKEAKVCAHLSGTWDR